jgi:hypothetical protein
VHSRSVGYPREFSRGWVYYYGCPSGCRFLASFRYPPRDTTGVAGWVWNGNEERPHPVTRMRVAYGTRTIDRQKMTTVSIVAPDSSFSIASGLELYRFSIIDDLGPILGTLLKVAVGKPVTRFYQAEATPSPGASPQPGILEVMRFE